MKRIINKEPINYLLLRKEQDGFIRKRSTCTNFLESLHHWTRNLQRHTTTDVVYFELTLRKLLPLLLIYLFYLFKHLKLLTKLPAEV